MSAPSRSDERLCDLTGCPLTCGSQEALELFNKALKSLVSGVGDFGFFLFKAVQVDGSLVLARCALVGTEMHAQLRMQLCVGGAWRQLY